MSAEGWLLWVAVAALCAIAWWARRQDPRR